MLISRIFLSPSWKNSLSSLPLLKMMSLCSAVTWTSSAFSKSTPTRSLKSRVKTSKSASCWNLKLPSWTSASRHILATSPMSTKSLIVAAKSWDLRRFLTQTPTQWSYSSNSSLSHWIPCRSAFCACTTIQTLWTTWSSRTSEQSPCASAKLSSRTTRLSSLLAPLTSFLSSSSLFWLTMSKEEERSPSNLKRAKSV